MHTKKTCRIAFALLLALSLSYCSTTSQIPRTPAAWQQHTQQVLSLNTWELQAKLAIRIPKNNHSANLNWQQAKQHYTIQLAGPFGAGKVIITGNQNQATLKQAGHDSITANSADALLYEATGRRLPLAQLTTWILGIPNTVSSIESIDFNENGLLRQLEQAGWKINYSRYKTYYNIALPGRIVATRNDMKLILAIHRWKIND